MRAMIKAILTKIEQGQRFLVASHRSPDGDAIASTLALVNLLREMGKDVVAYNGDPIPVDFSFLPDAWTVVDQLPHGRYFDAGFILDAGELSRAGSQLRECCETLVNIDHHPHSERFGQIHYVDEAASATGALIYRIIKAGNLPISREVALCIYTAILADTGSFRYSNADPEAFLIASEMVALGVQPWDVASGLYESQNIERLRLLALALTKLTVSASGLYASLAVTASMYKETGAGPEHTDGFINYPRSIRGVEVALFFRQIDQHVFKVGFRSKGKIDVGALSRDFGGGGHHNAAGAVIEGTLEVVRGKVNKRLDVLLPEIG